MSSKISQVVALQSFLAKILRAVSALNDAGAHQEVFNIPPFHGTCTSYISRSFMSGNSKITHVGLIDVSL